MIVHLSVHCKQEQLFGTWRLNSVNPLSHHTVKARWKLSIQNFNTIIPHRRSKIMNNFKESIKLPFEMITYTVNINKNALLCTFKQLSSLIC